MSQKKEQTSEKFFIGATLKAQKSANKLNKIDK